MAINELYLNNDFKQAWQGQDPFVAADSLQGLIVRQLEQRKTLVFELNGKKYFVKIHKGVRWKEIFKNLLQLRLPIISAKNEWLAIQSLKRLKIDSLTAVAYGKRGGQPATIESFLITEDIGPNQSLEELCANWITQPPSFVFKQKLIRQLALVARSMHRNGICHRDFYICHFLLLESDNFKISLIDLHRALVKKRLSLRWLIKDIGSLYFSAFDIGLTRSDLFRFMKIYSDCGLAETLTKDEQFWLKVERRALWIKAKSSRF